MRIFSASGIGLFFTVLCLNGCSPQQKEQKQSLHSYDYRDTRKLTALLSRATKRIEHQGTNAFAAFRANKKKWSYKDAYLYVYATNGVCLYHAGMPDLEGQQLLDMTDASGHRTLQDALSAVLNKENLNGWVHYWWSIPNRLYPVWKSSCHNLVKTPDGESILVGTGMANLPRERVFIKIIVDSAAQLLEQDGEIALAYIQDPESHYSLPGSPLFVVSEQGNTLIAPSFHIDKSMNILDYEDDAGHTPLRTALQRLEHTNTTWVILLVQAPASMNMHKKGLYVRKTKMGTNTVFVAATADLPKPSWMD